MKNIKVSPDALMTAAAELEKRSRSWLEEAAEIPQDECREKMKDCGRIISEYAALLKKAGAEYEETMRKQASLAGEMYEQI